MVAWSVVFMHHDVITYVCMSERRRKFYSRSELEQALVRAIRIVRNSLGRRGNLAVGPGKNAFDWMIRFLCLVYAGGPSYLVIGINLQPGTFTSSTTQIIV